MRDRGTLARIRALVIPPAWQEVWICADPAGHIQAVGTDAAGRRQYRYHDLWRAQRDQESTTGCWGRVLAAAAQLIDLGFFRPVDLGFFRPGGEEYAAAPPSM